MVRDMTSGKPLRLITSFSLPLIIGNVFQQMYSMVDTIIVGKFLGNAALAAVGATGSITFLIIGFINGVAEGSCILVAQYFGSGDRKNLKRCVGNIIYVSILLVAIMTIVALWVNEPLLKLMQTPDDIIEDAKAYLDVIYAGMFATMLYNVLAGLLRALGDSRSPLYFLLIASVLNIVLDIYFIVGLNAGVAGAAYATVISQLVSAICCFIYILKKCEPLRLGREDMKIRPYLIGRICLMGIPMALQYSVTAVGSVILQSAVNPLGSDAVAAISVGSKILNMSWAIINSIGVAIANFCGQNIGAGRLDRVRSGVRSGSLVVGVITVIFTLGLFFFGVSLSVLFLEEGSSDEVPMLIDRFMKIQAPFLIALALIGIFRNTIQGMGYSLQAMAAGLFELVGRSFVALMFVGQFGYDAVCIASPVAWMLADALLVPLYFWMIHRIKKLHPQWALPPEKRTVP